MKNLFIILILFVITNSCIDEYDLNLKSTDARLVVEGAITNQNGPYLIRLTKSRLIYTYDNSWFSNPTLHVSSSDTIYPYNIYTHRYDGTEAVKNAEAFITDVNTSITDTLVKCPIGKWHHFADSIHNNFSSHFDVADTSILFGYYKTTKLKGIPGHTYALTIKWAGQEYHAESYMPPVPPLDSVQFNFTKGAIGKVDYNIPLIFFKEPQNERNYYLFNTAGGGSTWAYSVLSDEYLKDYVNGLDVCKGVSPDYWRTAYPWLSDDGKLTWDYFIEMHSITKEAYEYYKALLQQFKTDGGGYSPSPASPPTNLDNGALGFFRASAVNRVDFKADRN